MNKIGIYGIIKKIIDPNKLIYILESEELSFIINGTKVLYINDKVFVIGTLDYNIEYEDREDRLIESDKYLIIDCDSIVILDKFDKYYKKLNKINQNNIEEDYEFDSNIGNIQKLDNQKLEDEIQILKQKLQISDDKNRELNHNNQILIKKIDEMKKSTLYFEDVLKIKDNEIVSLKSAITYKKDNKEEYQDILKDNQRLKDEIEELKKYYSKFELNVSMKEEGQKISKVVERESFSDF